MAERRSLGAAVQLSPEVEAFIHGARSKSDPRSLSVKPERAAVEKTVDLAIQDKDDSMTDSVKKLSSKGMRPRQNKQIADGNEVLDQLLVPITFRLQHKTSQALKRAYLEQKLKHSKPDTIQEIGEQAISDWLRRAGYLKSI